MMNGVTKHSLGSNESTQISNTEECREQSEDLVKKSDASLNQKSIPCTQFEMIMERWKSFGNFNSDDTKIWNKLWKYYEDADPAFKTSRKFKKSLEDAQENLSKENIFTILKNIRDDLKSHTRSSDHNTEGDPPKTNTSETKADGSIERKLSRIEARMKVVAKKIKELEKEEVDLDDDVNSSYLLWSRLKEQYVKLDKMYCKLARCSKNMGRASEKKLTYEGSRYPEINIEINKWVNETKSFPDFRDIVEIVRKVSSESNLLLRPSVIQAQAVEIFQDVGMLLKKRRLADDLDSLYGYGETSCPDPADEDPHLASQLDSNLKVSKKKFQEVFEEFVEKQNELAEKGINLDSCSDEDSQSDESDSQINGTNEELANEELDSPTRTSDESTNSDPLEPEEKENQNLKRKIKEEVETPNKNARCSSPELVCLD